MSSGIVLLVGPGAIRRLPRKPKSDIVCDKYRICDDIIIIQNPDIHEKNLKRSANRYSRHPVKMPG